MEPIHPVDADLQQALIPVILGAVLLYISIHFGLWDKFLVLEQFTVNGVMGLWGG